MITISDKRRIRIEFSVPSGDLSGSTKEERLNSFFADVVDITYDGVHITTLEQFQDLVIESRTGKYAGLISDTSANRICTFMIPVAKSFQIIVRNTTNRRIQLEHLNGYAWWYSNEQNAISVYENTRVQITVYTPQMKTLDNAFAEIGKPVEIVPETETNEKA